MVSITLDTNCIIDLEEQRPGSEHLLEIITAWRKGRIDLAVVAISASENQPGGGVNETYGQFQEKLAVVGLAGATELLPLAYWDVFYWGHALWSNEDMKELEIKIRNVLFPGMSFEPPHGEREARVWRNRLCDVLVAWSSAHHKQEILLTRDENFHRRKDVLAQLGVGKIMYPADAVKLCRP